VAWDVKAFGLSIARWRYRFEPNGRGGTTVTESTEDTRGRVMDVVGPAVTGVRERADANRRNMRATLGRLKEAAEAAVAP
jgi:hypothetical protein